MTAGTFPFGAPVRELALGMPLRAVSTFVLGAYPSAVHVEWTPPRGLGRRVAALPVDNEPYPFWDGSGMDHFVERWRHEFFRSEWGAVHPARLNGSSGRALYERWLAPLGVPLDDYFVTDCLPTSMMSTGVANVVKGGVYADLIVELGLPQVSMAAHPSENDIVKSATQHVDRISAQLAASGARRVVTLGNAAARVMQSVGGPGTGGVLRAETYLQTRRVRLQDREIEWHALVHPAVRAPWIERHDEWINHQTGRGRS